MIIRSITAAATTAGTPPVSQTIVAGSGPGSTLQPKAAVYELTSTVTLDTQLVQRRHGIGLTDGSAQRALGVMSESGNLGAASDAGTRANGATVIDFPLTTSEAVDAVAAWSAWQNGGSDISWSNLAATAVQIKATYFFGADIECAVVEVTNTGADGSTSTVSGLSFAPNFVQQISTGIVGPYGASTGVAHLSYGFGYAVKAPDGTIQQWCVADTVSDRAATTQGGTVIRNDAVVQTTTLVGNVPALGVHLSLTSWNSDGATFTKHEDSAHDITAVFLFIGFKGNRKLYAAVHEVTLGSPGDLAITAPGFTPEAYFIGATCLADPNTLFTTGAADTGKISHGVYTGQENVYCSGSSDDGVGTSATISATGDNYVFRTLTTGGVDRFAGTHVSLDDNGFTLAITGTLIGDGSPNFGYVAIGPQQIIETDSETIVDQHAINVSEALSDSETIVDQAVLTGSAPAQSDSETITDQTVLSATGNLAFDDTEDLLDQHAFALDIAHSDTEEISENVILLAIAADALLIVVSDSVTVDDQFVFSGTGSLVFSDTVEIEDRGNLAGDALIVVSDSETITENEQHYLGNVIVVSDTETITDDLSTPITATQTKGTQRGTSFQGGAEQGQALEGGAERGTVL